ncbi:hypothetical protein K933_15405, partial [Candidatus Halobonum tyrrellensis G22]
MVRATDADDPDGTEADGAESDDPAGDRGGAGGRSGDAGPAVGPGLRLAVPDDASEAETAAIAA